MAGKLKSGSRRFSRQVSQFPLGSLNRRHCHGCCLDQRHCRDKAGKNQDKSAAALPYLSGRYFPHEQKAEHGDKADNQDTVAFQIGQGQDQIGDEDRPTEIADPLPFPPCHHLRDRKSPGGQQQKHPERFESGHHPSRTMMIEIVSSRIDTASMRVIFS